MRRRLRGVGGGLAAVLVAAAGAEARAGAPAAPGTGRWVTAYYVGYQRDRYPVDKVDFGAITHLVAGRVRPLVDGSLDTSLDIDAVKGPRLARELSRRAHEAGRKALLMVGGAGEHAGWVSAASEANRPRFVRNLLDALEQLGYDGLDLDWEPLEIADRPAIEALARELRAARPGIVLTLPVSWVNVERDLPVDPWFGRVARLFDQLNVMSYQMAGAWGWLSWHSSALHGAEGRTPSSVASSAIAYADAGVPRSKIGIGIGLHGACWVEPVTGPRQPTGKSRVVAADNKMSYTRIMTEYFDPAARRWDDDAKAAYLSFTEPRGPKRCTFLSYEDEASIAAKGAWVRQHGFGGTIVWTVNQGYLASTGTNPPLEAVGAAFLR